MEVGCGPVAAGRADRVWRHRGLPLRLALSFRSQHSVLEHIRLRVLPPANLDLVGFLAEALLESGCVAGMRPEHPRLGRLLGGAVAVLDGKLRLPVSASDASNKLTIFR